MENMRPPVEPEKADCCNSGCNPCIFDVYEKQMKMYTKHLECGECMKMEKNGISQLEYTKFLVVKKMELCKWHMQIFFRNFSQVGNRVWWKPGDHFLFKYISGESSCTRAYTPIKVQSKDNMIDFSIVIKKYENGIVSTFLYNLGVGDETLWRGPYGHYEQTPDSNKRLIMIAQGTGIAPFISIIENILNNEDNMTRIHLLYCCKSVETILFRNYLYEWRSYWNFKYDVFITDIPENNSKLQYQEPIYNFRLNCEYLNQWKPFAQTDQFLLSGSSEFMEHYKSWLNNEVSIAENIIVF